MKITSGLKIWIRHNFKTKSYKGVKFCGVDAVMGLKLCISFDHTLYLNKVSRKYLKRVSEPLSGHHLHTII